MIRACLIAMVVVIAACGARAPNATTAKGEPLKWEGESCIRSSECFTLWCANGECVRREP